MYFLMVKKAYPSGLKYLCQTKREPYSYKGSGLRWENHIRFHNSQIITCVIGEYETMDELKAAGLHYSELFDVVKSEDWANLRAEDGTGGGAGKVGRRWKIKDTSRMGGTKTFTKKKADGYVRMQGLSNYQFSGWYLTPWGCFSSLLMAVDVAQDLRKSGDKSVITDPATIKRYCLQSDTPLSYAIRIPKSRQGKTPRELGFSFRENNDD